MAYKEIYQRYFSKLIKCLPMDDGLFLAMLSEHELLPGDTEGKVKSLATQTEKATYFISHVIKPSLDVDSRVYLNKLLLVMSESGYKHVEEISSRIKSEIANTENSKTRKMVIEKSSNNKVNDCDDYTERFTHDSDAVGAFVYLFNKLAAFFDEVEFKKFKRICTLRGADCPQDFRKQMQAAETLDDILDTLEKPNYCNWLNIRLLKRIVNLTEIPEAKSLLDAYEKCLYSKKVSEVRPYFKSIYFDPKHFTVVKAKVNKHADKLFVSDVIQFCETLESDFSFPEVIATDCDSGCFHITCIIPVQCTSHAYKMARDNLYKFRKFHIQYIEIEPYQKLFAMSYCISKGPSDLPLSSSKGIKHIISDHYTYLESHMDADSVSHMMHCEHLITDDDYDAIAAAPNDTKMNCLLLHYVKLMDIKEFFKFCDILKSIETKRGISESLETSLNSSELSTCTFMKEKPLKMDKWTSSLEPSHVHLRFFDLLDEIILLLSGADKIPFDLANKCRSLMASNTHNISLFTESFVYKLINCKSVFLLKILLLPFLSWYDHSILKELTSESDSITDLLTQFDSLIDPNKPITAYPIPTLSQTIIPLDDRFTIVATKSFCDLESSSLKETLNIKATLVGQWNITDHALQLIGICTQLNYVYWMVSKCVVSVIIESSHNYKSQYKLWEKGITMVAILPDLFINDLSISVEQFTGGPFNILSSHQDTESSLYNKLVSVDVREIAKQNVLMQNQLFIQYQRLMSDYKYAMSKWDNAETTLKLKVPKLENEYKILVKKYQEIKEKNSELERSYALLQKEKDNLQSQMFFDDDKAEEEEEKEEEDEDEEEEEEEEEEEDESEDGRQRRYERDFVLSLKFLEQCKQRPPNLMNTEYIRKELPRPSEMRFDPGYYDHISSGIRRKGMPYPSSKKKIDLPTKELVELRKAEKRWVRPAKLEAELAQAEKETQELFRKFVGILNKLTPQKFETLANQALEMPIDSEDRLKGCIDRIFIKALEEPNYSVAYAQLCRVLSNVSVEVGTGPDVKKKTFRSLLLTKCQQEFEKDKESDKVIAELKQKVEEAAPEEKKQLEEELSEKEYRLRRNYLGNIKFIGELFKIKMLSEGIMHECIRRLLQSTTDEEALECFAKLMFTIGKDLDHEKGQALIKQYMDRVELIINAGKISSRIKFFLQDVVELRNANWVPRRENNNPKKIDQIHQKAKLEEAEKMRELAAHPLSIRMGGRQVSKGSLDMDSRKKNVKDGSSKMGGDWSNR